MFHFRFALVIAFKSTPKSAKVTSVETIESVTEFSSSKVTESRPVETSLQSLPDYLQPLVNNRSINLTEKQRRYIDT